MPDRNHNPDAFWSTVVMDCAQISEDNRGTFQFAVVQDDEGAISNSLADNIIDLINER